MLKIDVFIHRDQPFFNHVFSRRQEKRVSENIAEKFFFPSPEDIILIKLDWFKSSGGSLSQQWADVLGVLKVQDEKLDLDYLKTWAKELSVLVLLKRAFEEVNLTNK